MTEGTIPGKPPSLNYDPFSPEINSSPPRYSSYSQLRDPQPFSGASGVSDPQLAQGTSKNKLQKPGIISRIAQAVWPSKNSQLLVSSSQMDFGQQEQIASGGDKMPALTPVKEEDHLTAHLKAPPPPSSLSSDLHHPRPAIPPNKLQRPPPPISPPLPQSQQSSSQPLQQEDPISLPPSPSLVLPPQQKKASTSASPPSLTLPTGTTVQLKEQDKVSAKPKIYPEGNKVFVQIGSKKYQVEVIQIDTAGKETSITEAVYGNAKNLPMRAVVQSVCTFLQTNNLLGQSKEASVALSYDIATQEAKIDRIRIDQTEYNDVQAFVHKLDNAELNNARFEYKKQVENGGICPSVSKSGIVNIKDLEDLHTSNVTPNGDCGPLAICRSLSKMLFPISKTADDDLLQQLKNYFVKKYKGVIPDRLQGKTVEDQCQLLLRFIAGAALDDINKSFIQGKDKAALGGDRCSPFVLNIIAGLKTDRGFLGNTLPNLGTLGQGAKVSKLLDKTSVLTNDEIGTILDYRKIYWEEADTVSNPQVKYVTDDFFQVCSIALQGIFNQGSGKKLPVYIAMVESDPTEGFLISRAGPLKPQNATEPPTNSNTIFVYHEGIAGEPGSGNHYRGFKQNEPDTITFINGLLQEYKNQILTDFVSAVETGHYQEIAGLLVQLKQIYPEAITAIEEIALITKVDPLFASDGTPNFKINNKEDDHQADDHLEQLITAASKQKDDVNKLNFKNINAQINRQKPGTIAAIPQVLSATHSLPPPLPPPLPSSLPPPLPPLTPPPTPPPPPPPPHFADSS